MHETKVKGSFYIRPLKMYIVQALQNVFQHGADQIPANPKGETILGILGSGPISAFMLLLQLFKAAQTWLLRMSTKTLHFSFRQTALNSKDFAGNIEWQDQVYIGNGQDNVF